MDKPTNHWMPDEKRHSQPVEGELLGPPGSDPRDLRQLWLKLLATWTDDVFEVPGLGWRFGLDPLIGLVPIVGDMASALISFYILSVAAQMRVPRSTMLRMSMNVAIDYVVGAIPFSGNVFDFAWKANRRNMQLLDRHMAAPPSVQAKQGIWDWLFVGLLGLVLLAVFIGSIAVAIFIAGWFAHLVGLR